jgi:hypothetical protein
MLPTILPCQSSHRLLQAGLFSAVSAAFVTDIQPNLRPVPNEQSAAILLAILHALNQSAVPGETHTVPPIEEGGTSEVVTATCLMYASLLISLLAAFVAMLGRQWLNRYLRNTGGSVFERCGDRQRKFDELKKWRLHFFIESLPVMLQVALFLLASGLCQHMWSINRRVAGTLIGLTGLGAAFYIGIVVAGMSSYACPFQTPLSTFLRGAWKRVQRAVFSSGSYFKQVLPPIIQALKRWLPLPSPMQPVTQDTPLEDLQVQEPGQWLQPKDLTIIDTRNANDAVCVSWILRIITDPEALDMAIRLAGTIRWFNDGIDADASYRLIVTAFDGCFGPSGELYPGSRDMAYYSGRAMIWIHTLARRKSRMSANMFPLSRVNCGERSLDPDLSNLLQVHEALLADGSFADPLLHFGPDHTPSHMQWASDVLLHRARATRLDGIILSAFHLLGEAEIVPTNAILNRLLAWCISLGSPPPEEVLKVRNKSCDTFYFGF